ERMLGLTSYDKKEDDYKDLDRSISIPDAVKDGGTCFMIHGNILPTPKLVKAARKLKNGEFLSVKGIEGIIFRFTKKEIRETHKIKVKKAVTFREKPITIQYPWNISQLNDWALRQDFELLTAKKKSQGISKTNRVIKSSEIFIEKGVRMEHCILNASTGPIYIEKNEELMEGCMIRGPFFLGEGSLLKMGTKIYGATSLGPWCVGGGEIKSSVMFGYSNKAHDGYLGDSVIGEWCNLGAGTTNSNLKNNAGEIKLWTPTGKAAAGKKCGVMMGDYSRTAVNTAINTGTVIGVCCNVFGSGLTPEHIPSFSGGSDGFERYRLEKVFDDVESWKKLKQDSLSDNERSVLKYIFDNF